MQKGQDLPDYAAARHKAEDLVAQMTLDEKLAMVVSHFPILSPYAAERNMPMCSGYTPGIERLGIPALRITDASLGVAHILNMRGEDVATALPASLASGAAFDTDLAYRAGAMIAGEARAKTFNVLLGGGINLTRDPWAGRNFEYIGEDALHSAVVCAAAVRGVQSRHVACTLKHYVLNSQETGRMAVDAVIDEVPLRESDLLAFEIAIERSAPASIMAGYNLINGDYASENAFLINTVLKGEWDYPGWLMSDWGAVHSTVDSALSGLDQESGFELDEKLNGGVFFTDKLKAAVEDGSVPAARLDDMVSRILTGAIATGLFDHPVPEAPEDIDYERNSIVAQELAEAGMVLLRNSDGALPLPRSVRSIAVIGGNADVGVMSGGGSSQVRSVGGVPIERPLESGDSSWFCRLTYHASSPLEAIRHQVPDGRVEFASGDDLAQAVAMAADAEVAIVFVNQWRTEGTDLSTLALPDGQDELIAAIAAANSRTIVVLQSGGAVLMPWLEQVSAVLAAWYPGQRGGQAIARILFGDVNPSGRLPLTFPASDGDAPRPKPPGLAETAKRDAELADGNAGARIGRFQADYPEGANVGYRWFEANGVKPLFPFGFGLSYTRFAHADLAVEQGGRTRVLLKVSNVGQLEGADVVQAYVRAADGQGVRTWRLAAFARVRLDAGETKTVELELEPRTFAQWDATRKGWHLAEEVYDLAIGRSVADHVLTAKLDGRRITL